MLNNVTSHTTIHYSNEGATVRKKSGMETFIPIIMIAVGVIGVYLLMNG